MNGAATDGHVAYKAYKASTGGKTYDGRDMPSWSDLGEAIRAAWDGAASAVLALHRAEVGCDD